MLTQSFLKQVVHYSPESGLFTWVVPTGARVKPGRLAGSYYSNGYLRMQILGTEYLLHRLAWFYMLGEWPAGDMDHRNGVRDDNRWDNLRLATVGQNLCNTAIRKDNKSGVKGVSWDARKAKYSASICSAGVRRFVGYFTDLEEAKQAISTARLKYHGEFANHGSHTH